MKGSAGAAWTAGFLVAFLFLAHRDLSGGAIDAIGVSTLAFLGLSFLCRSIETRKEKK